MDVVSLVSINYTLIQMILAISWPQILISHIYFKQFIYPVVDGNTLTIVLCMHTCM